MSEGVFVSARIVAHGARYSASASLWCAYDVRYPSFRNLMLLCCTSEYGETLLSCSYGRDPVCMHSTPVPPPADPHFFFFLPPSFFFFFSFFGAFGFAASRSSCRLASNIALSRIMCTPSCALL
eukprot:Tamp_21864.p2 GENE.Tamp_21864~~Tamp_21864.p2  ORF type:complete len:124 (+),score=2.58 Tamp_21864:184-555(+)